MEIVISYSEALEQHPLFVKKWMDYGTVLGKRLGIKMDDTKIGWSYTFSVRGPSGYNFSPAIGVSEDGGETIEELNDEIHSLSKKTPEEIAKIVIANVYDIKINAVFSPIFSTKIKTESLEKLPELFVKKCTTIVVDSVKKEGDWIDNLDNLTPQEREHEELKLLNELFLLKEVMGPGDVQDIIPAPVKKVEYDINDILDKISSVGMSGLSADEKEFLNEHSQKP